MRMLVEHRKPSQSLWLPAAVLRLIRIRGMKLHLWHRPIRIMQIQLGSLPSGILRSFIGHVHPENRDVAYDRSN